MNQRQQQLARQEHDLLGHTLYDEGRGTLHNGRDQGPPEGVLERGLCLVAEGVQIELAQPVGERQQGAQDLCMADIQTQ